MTFAGDKYDWNSWQTYAMIGGSVTLAVLFAVTETKAAEPIIPLRLFRNRTIALATLASLFVGVAMFAARSTSASTSSSPAASPRPWPAS